MLFRKCGCLVAHGKYIFWKCFSVWLCVRCKIISVFILPSNLIFRKTERERERAHRQRPRAFDFAGDLEPLRHEPTNQSSTSPANPGPRSPMKPEPSTHEPSTSLATQSLWLRQKPTNRSLSLCDFDFCVILIFVVVVVVFWWFSWWWVLCG